LTLLLVCGEIEVLDILAIAGAELNTADIHGAYPIHYAAQMCGPNSDMGIDTRLGLKGKVFLTLRLNFLNFLLEPVLKYLMGRGVNVHVKDQDGREPLMWAASSGNNKVLATPIEL